MPDWTGVWEQFSIEDGLPDMKIECLYEDRAGTLWIGTHARGVVTYRGDAFVWSTTRDGLSDNAVYSIHETADGAICMATGNGLSLWSNGAFLAVEATRGLSFLWAGSQDDAGNLWFGLERQAGMPARVCRWDGKGAEVIPLERHATALGRSINSMVVDMHGGVWCGGHGLFVWRGGRSEMVMPERPELSFINAMGLTDSGALFVAATDGAYLLCDGQLTVLDVLRNQIEGLHRSASGAIWCTTRDGAILVYRDGGVESVASLGVPLWRAVVLDRVGRIWVGTYGFGLHSYDDTRVRIRDSTHGLGDNRVQAIAFFDGRTWAATSKGLATQPPDIEADLWKGDDSVSRDVTGLLSDTRGRLWMGKRNGAVYVLEDGNLTECATIEQMSHYRIDRFAEDAEGAIWVASSVGGGVGRYLSPQEFGYLDAGDDRFPRRVGAIAVSGGGSVFLGSMDLHEWDGVAEYRAGVFMRVTGYSGAPVTALCVDASDRLWIGTTEGVTVIDGEYVLGYGLSDGLTSELITCLCLDTKERVWIGTEGGGVCVFDGRVFQSLQLSDRPFCNTINCICEDRNGQMWFGTNGGLVVRVMKPSDVRADIDEVVADTTYRSPEEVQFPDTVGRVTFSFSGSSSIDRSGHLLFRFQLKGHESEWRQTREGKVDYPQLAPGGYEFLVQAVDSDLNYSTPKTVRVAVVADPRIDALNRALRAEGVRGDFVGESQAMRDVMQQIREVAWTDLTVLVLGETGTGKGLAARQIHELSERRDGPLIHVNCGSVQEGLVDSELFGHERGAFTGAVSRRVGKFELAHGGTIFLDEIGDLPVESQARLLKVLQDKTIERVGGTNTINVDVRVIAATNRDLSQAVRDHAYRADLYYRLNVFPIRLPPLRERREDTLILARHFMASFAAHLSQPTPDVTGEASAALLSYDWPGNVRELEHTLQRAVLLAKSGSISVEHLGIAVSPAAPTVDESQIIPLAEFEKRYFAKVLSHTGGVIHGLRGAARLLDMKPTTLRSRLEKLGIKTRRPRK